MIVPKSLPPDANRTARRVAKLLAGELVEGPQEVKPPVSICLSKIGRVGGLKGAKAGADKLSPTKRRKIARRAAMVRWAARPSDQAEQQEL